MIDTLTRTTGLTSEGRLATTVIRTEDGHPFRALSIRVFGGSNRRHTEVTAVVGDIPVNLCLLEGPARFLMADPDRDYIKVWAHLAYPLRLVSEPWAPLRLIDAEERICLNEFEAIWIVSGDQQIADVEITYKPLDKLPEGHDPSKFFIITATEIQE